MPLSSSCRKVCGAMTSVVSAEPLIVIPSPGRGIPRRPCSESTPHAAPSGSGFPSALLRTGSRAAAGACPEPAEGRGNDNGTCLRRGGSRAARLSRSLSLYANFHPAWRVLRTREGLSRRRRISATRLVRITLKRRVVAKSFCQWERAAPPADAKRQIMYFATLSCKIDDMMTPSINFLSPYSGTTARVSNRPVYVS